MARLFLKIAVLCVCLGGVCVFCFQKQKITPVVLREALPKGTIFVAHHRPFWIYKSEIYQPIQAGRKIASQLLDMPGDDVGDSISEKNPFYVELTSMYWAWKNTTPRDFIGFGQYRRYLNTDLTTKGTRIVSLSHLLSGAVPGRVFIQEEAICKLMQEYDVLATTLDHSPEDVLSVADNYCFYHKYEDWNALMGLLLEKHPRHHLIMNKAFQKRTGFSNNTFVMRTPLFQEYANWLFPLLFELEKRIVLPKKGDRYQSMVFGFVSERLFTLFIEIKKAESNIRVKELPLMLISEP